MSHGGNSTWPLERENGGGGGGGGGGYKLALDGTVRGDYAHSAAVEMR